MGDLSPHFSLAEFNCHDGTPVPRGLRYLLRSELVHLVLEPLRHRFGACVVISGYRPAAYNRSIGGAPDSRHIWNLDLARGLAADVDFHSGTPAEHARAASALLDRIGWGGGVGYYGGDGHLHVDTRRVRARWNG